MEKNCSSSRNSEADNIGPFVVLCIIVFLQNCTVSLKYNNAALSKIFHYMCMCTHALICSSLMCCNMQCARTDILQPQLSSYIAFCMYCHMCQCASAIYSLNWISMATHALPLGLQRKTLIAATNTRRNFFHSSSSSHSFYLPALCFILVPSIFCSSSSPNQIHPPPFLLTAQQHILCSFQARHNWWEITSTSKSVWPVCKISHLLSNLHHSLLITWVRKDCGDNSLDIARRDIATFLSRIKASFLPTFSDLAFTFPKKRFCPDPCLVRR